MAGDKGRLARRHVMLAPLFWRSDIQRQHLRLRLAAGGGQRQIIVKA